MQYKNEVIDAIGNLHPRKNKYLLDLANAKGQEIIDLKKNRNKHPYILKLNEYRVREKEFKLKLDEKAKRLCLEDKKKIKKIKIDLFKAENQADFYKEYIGLVYDAKLKYEIACHQLRYLPDIISTDKSLHEYLNQKELELKDIDEEKRKFLLEEIKNYKLHRKQELKQELRKLKTEYKTGIISFKALINERNIAKRITDEDVAQYSYKDVKKKVSEEIKNIKHNIEITPKNKLKVMKADMANTRANTPIEIEKKHVINAYATALIPGIGQLLNKQYAKGIFFLLLSAFVYTVCLPYFLGYGNFQGEGIYGLISLAEDGGKIDKSIIFLIEGVISIMLISIAGFIFTISFKDVKIVEGNLIKGIRQNNWFQTRQSIEREGFPYLVSVPAYLAIMFIVLVPIATTILISFTNLDPNHQNKFTWIGLQNYILVFKGQGIAGKAFWLILLWTVVWTICASTLSIFVGFVLSLIVNQNRIKGKKIFRTIYLLPWAVPAFITIMFFSLMLAKNGVLTNVLEYIFGMSIDVKSNPHFTRIALILLQTWLGSAYIFLLSTGVLQGIPYDLYEAAEIDGAKGFQRTLRITIPLVLFHTAPLLIMQYTFNFNNFSIIHLFNGGGPFLPSKYGNIAGGSELLISYIFKLTIKNKYQAVGATITVVISLVLMFISYLGFRRTKAFTKD